MEASAPSQANSPVFKGGRFSPLDRQHLTIAIHHLLQNTHYNYQHYASHSFRSSATTTAAAAAGILDWLMKFREALFQCATPVACAPAIYVALNLGKIGRSNIT